MMTLPARQLFDLERSLSKPFLETAVFPWEVLGHMPEILQVLIKELPSDFTEIAPGVWAGPGTEIAPTAVIHGPAVIGRNCQIRHAAFIREFALIGNEAVIGNSTEVKNAILFDGVQVPHFNYVGDSILGYKAHLGAGAILSNFKSSGDAIKATLPSGQRVHTGRNKFGALLGDHVEIGCNAVVFPGAIIGRNSIIYPLCPVRGYVPEATILKNDGNFYPRK